MLAARITAPRRMEMVDVAEPDLPPHAEGALLVEAKRSGFSDAQIGEALLLPATRAR